MIAITKVNGSDVAFDTVRVSKATAKILNAHQQTCEGQDFTAWRYGSKWIYSCDECGEVLEDPDKGKEQP